MNRAPIFFEFKSKEEAQNALDTLKELEFEASEELGRRSPTLHVHVEHADLTSALEIAQCCGGTLVELHSSPTEAEAFTMAYDMDDMFPIPAHIVNEDFSEAYATGETESNFDFIEPGQEVATANGIGVPIHSEADMNKPFDPSDGDYDHFSAGVRL